MSHVIMLSEMGLILIKSEVLLTQAQNFRGFHQRSCSLSRIILCLVKPSCFISFSRVYCDCTLYYRGLE